MHTDFYSLWFFDFSSSVTTPSTLNIRAAPMNQSGALRSRWPPYERTWRVNRGFADRLKRDQQRVLTLDSHSRHGDLKERKKDSASEWLVLLLQTFRKRAFFSFSSATEGCSCLVFLVRSRSSPELLIRGAAATVFRRWPICVALKKPGSNTLQRFVNVDFSLHTRFLLYVW